MSDRRTFLSSLAAVVVGAPVARRLLPVDPLAAFRRAWVGLSVGLSRAPYEPPTITPVLRPGHLAPPPEFAEAARAIDAAYLRGLDPLGPRLGRVRRIEIEGGEVRAIIEPTPDPSKPGASCMDLHPTASDGRGAKA